MLLIERKGFFISLINCLVWGIIFEPSVMILILMTLIQSVERGPKCHDPMNTSGQCLVLLSSSLPLVPILGEDVTGDVDLIGQPPGVAAFNWNEDRVTVK